MREERPHWFYSKQYHLHVVTFHCKWLSISTIYMLLNDQESEHSFLIMINYKLTKYILQREKKVGEGGKIPTSEEQCFWFVKMHTWHTSFFRLPSPLSKTVRGWKDKATWILLHHVEVNKCLQESKWERARKCVNEAIYNAGGDSVLYNLVFDVTLDFLKGCVCIRTVVKH